MSRVSELETEMADWVNLCPLRVWRQGRAKRIAQAKVGLLISRSAQAIRDYESGSYSPNEGAIVDLAGLMGIKPATLKRKWSQWMESKPKP